MSDKCGDSIPLTNNSRLKNKRFLNCSLTHTVFHPLLTRVPPRTYTLVTTGPLYNEFTPSFTVPVLQGSFHPNSPQQNVIFVYTNRARDANDADLNTFETVNHDLAVCRVKI